MGNLTADLAVNLAANVAANMAKSLGTGWFYMARPMLLQAWEPA